MWNSQLFLESQILGGGILLGQKSPFRWRWGDKVAKLERQGQTHTDRHRCGYLWDPGGGQVGTCSSTIPQCWGTGASNHRYPAHIRLRLWVSRVCHRRTPMKCFSFLYFILFLKKVILWILKDLWFLIFIWIRFFSIYFVEIFKFKAFDGFNLICIWNH